MRNFQLIGTGLFLLLSSCSMNPLNFSRDKNSHNSPEGDNRPSKKKGEKPEGKDSSGKSGESTGEKNTESGQGTGTGDKSGTLEGGDKGKSPAPSVNNNVVWKRYRALESGLMRALGLSKAELCNELDLYSCVDKVHLYNLGGNDPFKAAQNKRAANPGILTPLAVDRLVMHACANRIDKDRASGPGNAVVFRDFPLSKDPVPSERVEPMVTDLFRRLLARDPTAEELSKFVEFSKQGTDSERFSKTACFVIASMIENIFL